MANFRIDSEFQRAGARRQERISGTLLFAGFRYSIFEAKNMTPQLPFDSFALLQFTTGLRELQNKLQQLIEKTEKEIRELADLGPLDAVDVSCLHSSKESMFADSSRSRNQLRLVQRALERIRDGSFGICSACEEAIGLKRLQAVPWTRHCIQCQEQFEHDKRQDWMTA
jgi:DnaK suppressor protein